MKKQTTFAFLALTLLCTGLQAVNELWEAVREDNPQKVLALLQAGANPDGDYNNTIPLDLAATFNKIEIAKILLHNPYKQANINITDDMGDTPLKSATSSFSADIDMVQFLLEHGADPNKTNSCIGILPLHIMAIKGEFIRAIPSQIFQITKVLLDYGADLHAKDSCERKTPIEYAQKLNFSTNKPNTAFLEAVAAWKQEQICKKGKIILLINERKLLGQNIGFKFE